MTPQQNGPSEPDPSSDRMDMIAGGLATLGMVYSGLSSFDRWGSLFGDFGKAAAEPLEAVQDFIEEGKRRYEKQGGGTAAKARAALMSDSVSDGWDVDSEGRSLTERTEQLAEEGQNRKKRMKGLARAMSEGKASSAVSKMSKNIADPSIKQLHERATQEAMEKMLAQRGKPDHPDFEDYSPKYGADPNATAAMRAITWAGSGGDPFPEHHTQSGPDVPNNVNLDRDQDVQDALDHLQGQTGMAHTNPDDPAHQAFQQNQSKSTGQRIREQSKGLHEEMQTDVENYMEESEREDYRRRAKKAPLNSDVFQSLETAEEEYRHRFDLERMPQSESFEDMLLRTQLDDSFAGQFRDVQNRRGPVQTPSPEALGLAGTDREDMQMPQRSPNYADPTRSRAHQIANMGPIATSIGGQDAMEVLQDDSFLDSLIRDMREKLQGAVKDANKHLSHNIDLEIEKVGSGDGQHEAYQGRIKQGDATFTFNLPILSEQTGTYKTPGSKRAITHPLRQMLQNDLYGTAEEVMDYRDSPVMRPDELSAMKITNLVEKIQNDLQAGRVESTVDFINQRIIGDQFQAKSFATTSAQENMTKALQVQSGIEPLMEELERSNVRPEQFEQGLEGLENLRRMGATQSNFFAADSEFVSPESMGEAGTTSSAKMPFEVAGTVIDPDSDSAQASIRYRADLSGGDGNYQQAIEDEMKHIYQTLADKSESETQSIMKKMKTGGELVVRAPDAQGNMQKFDLLNQSEDALPSWVPRQESGSLSQYYMRVQNAMLERFDTDYAVGQNYVDAEHTVFNNLAANTEADLHRSITDQNVIDTMSMSQVLNPNNDIESASLSSITQTAFGMDKNEYEQAKDAVQEFVTNRADQNPSDVSRNQMSPAEMQAMQTASEQPGGMDSPHQVIDYISDPTDSQRRFLGRVQSVAGDLPRDVDPHTAEFDTFVTGRLALPEIEKFASSEQGRIAERRAKEVLNQSSAFLGDRRVAEQYGEMPYRSDQEGGEEGPTPFFANQEAATMGRGVMMTPGILPLHRLQNPVRQLYQRTKPRELLGNRPSISSETVTMRHGTTKVRMPRRARLPGDGLDALRYSERMDEFGRQGSGAGQDPLATSREAPMMFAGQGVATRKQREVALSHSGGKQTAVTNRVAFLPNDAEAIFESRGRSTAARRRAMRAKPPVRDEEVNIDMERLISKFDEGGDYNTDKYASKHMQDWIEEKAKGLGLRSQNYKGENVAIQNQDRALGLLKESYTLAMIKEDQASGLNQKAHRVINKGIEQRWREAQGIADKPKERIENRLREYRGGDSTMAVGDRETLNSPQMGKNPIVKDSIQTPENQDLIALDMGIRETEDGKLNRLQLSFIEDPGNVFKEQTVQAKVGNAGARKEPVAGMAGEQAVMEAAAMKSKRRDFAGYPRYQAERLYNQSIEQLQTLMQEDTPSLKQRDEVIQRFARGVSEMTDGELSPQKIRDTAVREKVGGNKFADFFQFTYTDELSRALEERSNQRTVMNAAETVGLSMQEVIEKGATMVDQAKESVDFKSAQRDLADMMRRQLDNEIEKTQELTTDATVEDYFDGDRSVIEEKKEEIQSTRRTLKNQRDELQRFAKGEIDSLSDTNLNQSGSLFDVFVDAESGESLASFRTLSSSQNVDSPPTGGSNLGEDFESRTGRATSRKRSSLLSTALVGHSASHTMGALGSEEKMAREVMQGWLSTKSGATAFSDKKFQREVYNALKQAGVNAKKWMDPNKIKSGSDGELVYETENGPVKLEQYVRDKFEWDAESGQLIFKGGNGQEKALQVDAYTTLRDTRKKQAGVLAMVTGELETGQSVSGTPIGGEGRTLTLSFTEGAKENTLAENLKEDQITPEQFHGIFGKRMRAQQHFQHTQGRNPSEDEIRSHRGNYTYFEEGADKGKYGQALEETIFNEQYDFLEVDIFGGMQTQMHEDITESLKQAGASKEMISRTLMGGTAPKRALTQMIDDKQERQRIENLIDYARERSDTSGNAGTKMFLETKMDARPESVGGGMQKANISQWANLADRLDPEGPNSIDQVRSAVKRIENTAKRLEVEYGDLNNLEAQRELKRTFDQELSDTIESGAFQETEQLFASTLRQSATGLINQMEEMEGRYLGGKYGIAMPQQDLTGKFEGLMDAMDSPGGPPSDEFLSEVEKLATNAQPELRKQSPRQFDQMVARAADDLQGYMKTQMDQFGGEVHRWRGFGVGEGFIGRSEAADIKSQIVDSHKGMEEKVYDQHIDDPTSPTAQAKKRLQETGGAQRSAREVEIAKQEVASPGSTPGFLFTSIRQPDFTATGGYEMSRLTAMGDESLRIMGRRPDQVHSNSHPIVMASRKEDSDFDLNYMAPIDHSTAAGYMRDTRADTMPENLANIWQMMEDAGAGLEGVSVSSASEKFTTEVDTMQLDDGRTVQSTRVTTEFGGENIFNRSVGQFFSAAGLALDATASGKEARTAYAQQQSVVGQFGAYAKSGAFKTRQRNNAFTDMMERLNMAAKEMKEEHGDADVRQAFTEMFNKEAADMVDQQEVDNAWRYMNQTFEKFAGAKDGKTGVAGDMHKVALTELEITQNIAIEKYKYGEPQQVARKVQNIMQTLHGNHSGGYNSFDEAFEGLMGEDVQKNLPFSPVELFGSPDDDFATKKQMAKEAFRTNYDQARSMKIAQRAGIGNEYFSRVANVESGEVGPGRGLSMADSDLRSSIDARFAAQTELPNAAASALESSELDASMQEFQAVKRFRNRQLSNIIEAPSSYQEKMSQAIKDLPTSGKVAGGIAAAAGAMLTASSLSGVEPDTQAGSEQYDTPNFTMGNDRTNRRLMQMQERQHRQATWASRRRGASGREIAAERPPAVHASY